MPRLPALSRCGGTYEHLPTTNGNHSLRSILALCPISNVLVARDGEGEPLPMTRLVMAWRAMDVYFKRAIILYIILLLGGLATFFMYGCTLNITISDTAPGLEVPADQTPPTKNM